jgi:SAM-dependent methyltransferase
MLFDRLRLRHRPHLPEADFLYVRLAEEIVDRLSLVARRFERGLAAGPVTPAIRATFGAAPVRWTFVGPGGDIAADLAMPFAGTFPLAVSINDLHLADDPVAALAAMRGTLVPDGLFLGAVASAGTLGELADALLAAEADLSGGAAMRVAPFADVRRWGDGLARAGFAMPVADEVRLTVRYGSLDALLTDLRRMGLRGVLATRRPAPRRLFTRAEAIYRATASDADGRLRATFAFAFLSGWVPDPGQRKPARRGSATVRLADALRAIEKGGD